MVLKFDELKTILFYSYSYTVDRECFCFFVFFIWEQSFATMFLKRSVNKQRKAKNMFL